MDKTNLIQFNKNRFIGMMLISIAIGIFIGIMIHLNFGLSGMILSGGLFIIGMWYLLIYAKEEGVIL